MFDEVERLGLGTRVAHELNTDLPDKLLFDNAAAKGAGLTIMPLLAQFIITGWDWRTAWITLGILAFAIGVIPPVLFMARRPEDMGLEPDPARHEPAESVSAVTEGESRSPAEVAASNFTEPSFTVRQAFHTRAFWLLAAFTAAGFMVQAGVSLHQVAHYINQGLPGPSAALTAS